MDQAGPALQGPRVWHQVGHQQGLKGQSKPEAGARALSGGMKGKAKLGREPRLRKGSETHRDPGSGETAASSAAVIWGLGSPQLGVLEGFMVWGGPRYPPAISYALDVPC